MYLKHLTMSSWCIWSFTCRVRVMVFNATFINISVISWRSVSFVGETGVPRENHRPVASHWPTLSHNVVSSTPRVRFDLIALVVICTDCIGSCKSNYHTITTTTCKKRVINHGLCNYLHSVVMASCHLFHCDHSFQQDTQNNAKRLSNTLIIYQHFQYKY
jgi:hypothetical protein